MPSPPDLGQIQPKIDLVEFALRGFEALDRQVAAINEREHVLRDAVVAEMPRGLTRTQVATHGKDSQQIAFGRLLDLGHVAGKRAEMSGESHPLLDVSQHVKDVPCGHAFRQRILQCHRGLRDFAGSRLTQHRLSEGIQNHVTMAFGKPLVQRQRCLAECVA